jgi:hypothetical protein
MEDALLSTAELLLGLTRHLRTYTRGPERTALGQLEFARLVSLKKLRLLLRRQVRKVTRSTSVRARVR